MTIANEITKLNTNLSASYTACNNKGATMPANQNFDNLATCIGSIQTGGGSTLITKTITANGTYNASSDNADGYSSVTVNVSGGGSGTSGGVNCIVKTDGSVSSLIFESVNINNSSNSNIGIKAYATLPSLTNIINASGSYTSSTTALGNELGAEFTFPYLVSDVEEFNFPNLIGLNLNSSGHSIGNSTLKKIDLSGLIAAKLTSAFRECTALEEVNLSKLSDLTESLALGGSVAYGGAFANCTSLTTLSFPSLTSTSFGTRTNQFNNMLKGVTGCTVHFPSNLQSVIGTWSSVSSGFGGTNTNVLFDLPATT